MAVTAAVALAVGAGSAFALTAGASSVLTTSQVVAKTDPGIVDVVSSLGDQSATSSGTGIVLTSSGEILTNNHVIEGATSIKVTDIGNKKTYTAKVVGYDATQDIAVIQLENASGLTIASLGDSSALQTGDSVVALGNAGGKGGTPSVAEGSVTGLNQSITASDELSGVSEQLTGLIEDNADIQAGDSGGSLVDSYGQVIGMDTAAATGYSFQGGQSQGGQSQGGQSNASTEDAYAIPINEALTIAKQIEAGTTSAAVHIGATAFLGVELEPASQSSGAGYGGYGGSQGSSTTGVTVAGTLSGSPAANAGLTEGDTITAIGGQSVTTSEDIAKALVKYHPGDSISVTWVNQEGTSQTSNLTLTSGPAA
jgi:S1-C subfamily serine protease